MISFLNLLNGPWERVRGYLKEDLDALQTAINSAKSPGYDSGGRAFQLVDKTHGVTLNKLAGDVTLQATSISANSTVSFNIVNSLVGATDIILVNHVSGGTFGAYSLNAHASAGFLTIDITNLTAAPLAEAIIIRFAVVKSVNS